MRFSRFSFILPISLIFLFSACSSQNITSVFPGSQSGSDSQSGAYQASLDPDTRLELAKKRRSYLSGIRKGDFYSLQNAPEEALSYYLSIAEKIPEDQVVKKKIAHVYYLLKNWKQAYSTYVQVPISELSESEQTELYRSLFFDESRIDRLGELAKLPDGKEKPYYQTIDACYSGIHNCIISIQSATGSDARIIDLKNQIPNALKISEDLQYRNLLVAAKFYEQGMYRVSEKISTEILQNRRDYTEAIKIQGFSAYELGEYELAKKSLLQYLEKNPNDLESIVRMGEISFFLADYTSSNLYLNNAILAGYTPKADLERRLIHNYTLQGDSAGAMKVLNYLLQDADITADDFAVGVSFALEQGQNEKAKSWAIQGLQRFRNSPLIEPLYIQVLRLTGDRDDALAILQNTSEAIQMQNPNYQLEKAILLLETGNQPEAKILFQKLSYLTEWPDIQKEAQVQLEYIQSLETASGSTHSWW